MSLRRVTRDVMMVLTLTCVLTQGLLFNDSKGRQWFLFILINVILLLPFHIQSMDNLELSWWIKKRLTTLMKSWQFQYLEVLLLSETHILLDGYFALVCISRTVIRITTKTPQNYFFLKMKTKGNFVSIMHTSFKRFHSLRSC